VLKLKFDNEPASRLVVLALGSHADDIEIGCGGTILHLLRGHPDVEVHWIVLSGGRDRAQEARASAESFLEGAAQRRILVESFRDGFFPYEGATVKEFFERLKSEVAPDVIFTHQRHDLHQDHSLVSDLTWNTFRDHLILEYEIPKFDGDFGTPNFFVHLTEETCDTKIASLMTHFGTQLDRHWFTADVFRSLLRLRGMEARSPSGHAEAFYCRKIAL
jgi:LmbE family N-acetylglucosaminyl deacetylase